MKTYILLLALLFTACTPTQRLQRLYTRHPYLVPTDSVKIVTTIRDTVIYRDTIINLYLPSDTLFVQDTVLIIDVFDNPVDGKVSSDTLRLESRMARAWSWVLDNELNLQLADKDTTLPIRLENAIKEIQRLEKTIEEKNTIITKKQIPKFYMIMAWVGVVLSLLGIFYLILITILKRLRP